jgi:hypothetical protein
MNLELLNGRPKCTLIEAFDGKVFILAKQFRREFINLTEAKNFVNEQGWEVNVGIIHGSPILRRIAV